MKKIGFIGAYDKTNIILAVAAVLAKANKKVLIVDNTITQKCKYVVPVINPTKSYVTRYEDIDVAVGLNNIDEIKKYLGLDDNETLEYDYLILDTDNYDGLVNFSINEAKNIYFVTGFDSYSLKRGIEILTQLCTPIKATRIFFSTDVIRDEEDYFEYLVLGTKVIWNEKKILFLIENGDAIAIAENQRISRIKLSNLSNQYRENIKFLVNDIDPQIGEKTIRNIIKWL